MHPNRFPKNVNYHIEKIVDSNHVFVAGGDKKFFRKYGPTLIKSAIVYNNPLHIHLINPDPFSLAVAKYFDVGLSWEDEKWDVGYAPTYYSAARLLIQKHLLEQQHYTNTFVIDMDGLFNGHVEYKKRLIGLLPCPTYFFMPGMIKDDEWHIDRQKFNCMGVQVDIERLSFLNQVALMMDRLPTRYSIEQVAIARVVEQYKIEYERLEDVVGYQGEPECPIWAEQVGFNFKKRANEIVDEYQRMF